MQTVAERAIYVSAVRGQTRNTSYPYKTVIACKEDLARAAAFDHVCAHYADGKNSRGDKVEAYRSKKTFQSAAFCMYDCDNLPDNPLADDLLPEQWKQPADVDAAFPNVEHYRVYSRNHMKEKDGKPARPKWHDYFPLRRAMTSADRLEAFNQSVRAHFPAYDRQALDAARFVFGVENPVVEYIKRDLFPTFVAQIPAFQNHLVFRLLKLSDGLHDFTFQIYQRVHIPVDLFLKIDELRNRCFHRLQIGRGSAGHVADARCHFGSRLPKPGDHLQLSIDPLIDAKRLL